LPIVPVRDLGSDGCSPDLDPYSAPIKTFSMAVNARFEDNKISRGPINSLAGSLSTASTPQFSVAYKQLSGTYKFHICNGDGRILDWQAPSTLGGSSSETDISVAGFTPGAFTGSAWTTCTLNDVVYVNRPDRPPWFKTKSATGFTDLSTTDVSSQGWDPSWRAASIREVAGVLVAINVQQSGIQYPAKIMTSDYMTFDNAAIQWLPQLTNSATYNTLPDIAEPIVDGFNLGSNMILYANHETWVMQPTYNQEMFTYNRIFKNWGTINQNCVAEVNNVHYVFGSTDIWKHDGYNQASLAAGKTRDFIFNNLVSTQAWQFFTFFNPRLNEIMFCYVSTDSYCAYPVGGNIGYPGCNRAAVLNLRSGAWYFYDLPYIASISLGAPGVNLTYSQLGSETYSQIGSAAYTSFESPSILVPMSVSPAVSGLSVDQDVSPVNSVSNGSSQTIQNAVRSFDRYGSPALFGSLDTVATAPVLLEKSSMDLDSLQENLRAYKVVKSMYPEARLWSGSQPMSFTWGSTDYPGSPPPILGNPQTFDGSSLYKLDFNLAGRYLSLVVTYNDFYDFSLTGFDFDFQNTGMR